MENKNSTFTLQSFNNRRRRLRRRHCQRHYRCRHSNSRSHLLLITRESRNIYICIFIYIYIYLLAFLLSFLPFFLHNWLRNKYYDSYIFIIMIIIVASSYQRDRTIAASLKVVILSYRPPVSCLSSSHFFLQRQILICHFSCNVFSFRSSRILEIRSP